MIEYGVCIMCSQQAVRRRTFWGKQFTDNVGIDLCEDHAGLSDNDVWNAYIRSCRDSNIVPLS